MKLNLIAPILFASLSPALLIAQNNAASVPLDPAYTPSVLHATGHKPLPEEFIWTAGDAAALRPDHARFTYHDQKRKTEAHAFRAQFSLSHVPTRATLFIAGPRSVKAYLNGSLVFDASVDPASTLGTHVFRVELHSGLRVGRNLLAIEAVRGMGIVAAADSPLIQQLAYGEKLVVKIEDGSSVPLLISNGQWRSVVAPASGWQQPGFDDHAWPLVQSVGGIESRLEFFQWNIDAGMYDWPGYIGMSPDLRTYPLLPSAIVQRDAASGSIRNAEALLKDSSQSLMTIELPAASVTIDHAPSLLLDFGREVAGRVLIRSACDCTAKVMVSYGESVSEALNNGHYLGENLLTVPPHDTARGPKSGFRYAWIHVLDGAPQTAFRAIEAEGIAYPVTYAGSFVSSDARLNTIWKTAAYTAHLCMQDGVWDAPKRDRGWWAGDLDVSGPVIEEVFGDTRPLRETLTQLLPPKSEPVNGIPGYTALWITSLASVYRQDGNVHDLRALHAGLLQLLAQMDAEFDGSGNFLNRGHRWLFVDWSPGLFESTPRAVTGTEMQFLRGYRDGAWLLRQIGDDQQARMYEQKAEVLQTRLHQQFQQAGGLYSGSPQLNALAVLSGVADAGEYAQIWKDSLSNVGKAGSGEPIISPYFNDYLLQAMTEMGHRQAALDWVRAYWGGMIDEGATSFWEAYDLRWPKKDPHTALQADGRVGYYVSLAHGWSSGPAAWLLEEVLGVHATEPAFRTVTVRPDLLDLQWVHGSVATPHGAIDVAIRGEARTRIELTLPAGIAATVLVPVLHSTDKILVDGAAVPSTPAEGGTRASILLRKAGQYTITSR